jgi:hypothetical protein
VPIVLGVSLFGGCDNSTNTPPDNDSGSTGPALTLNLELPNSITGGTGTGIISQGIRQTAQAGTGAPCVYMGADDDDPFRNGYEMTKFMVSAIATWTCIADTLIEIAETVEHDGSIHETDNDISQESYDDDDPTHYLIKDDSDTQTTIHFYYGYDRESPPQPDEEPQFFLSWNLSENGDIDGRMIIDSEGINAADRELEDPIMARMDFNYDNSQKRVDMFMRFDENNVWAEGFRIQITKDLSASLLDQVFTALGLIEMNDQFLPLAGIDEVPILQFFTVSDALGKGAALAKFVDISLPLELNSNPGNHLGNYLFDKDDIYFFDADGDWDWIDKSISDAIYRGSRTTPATGGTWLPIFDPSLDMIAEALALGSDYFTGSLCAETGDDCTALLNAVFEDGFADQEDNQGMDPGDWRSNAIAGATYLDSIYPNGMDWGGAFAYVFTP